MSGALLVLVVNAAIWGLVSIASDKLGRNHAAGIRLPSLMRSDEAWRAGHLAARKAMLPFLIAAAVVVVISIPAQLAPAFYVVLLGISLACTLAALGAGTLAASRAARGDEPRAH
ncbi:SdpI family protein [Curtobacterium sp. MCBD17_026]|uniref:SdpI family protein n=1 Tax=Curtobacterium sp. MCBD17_026 TaxID=2175621 RepID=UPI001C653EF0|nr:SdpI family protein [Curtobacterium sp. MCBD17_026]WIB72519.1 SdpI family protein [Curtobacterium sp. MCBD17_026]